MAASTTGWWLPGDRCNPDGMTSGQPLRGECKTAPFVCRGSEGWKCQGGVGRSPRFATAKDNDCDGVVDNNAPCAAGLFGVSASASATCVTGTEAYMCSKDRYCKTGLA